MMTGKNCNTNIQSSSTVSPLSGASHRSRRKRASFIALPLLLSLILSTLVACQREEPTATLPEGIHRYNSRFLGVFDTVTNVVGLAESEEGFEALNTLIQERLEHYHRLFDTFKSYDGINNLKTVNEQAGIAPVEVDPAVIQLMDQALAAYERSNGEVNMALGSVLEIWHDFRDAGLNNPAEAELPPMEKLQAANAFTDITKVEIDRDANTIFLPLAEMSLDVGSGAKGLAVELVSEEAKSAGYHHFLLSVGGNVKAVGFRDSISENWRVGIQDPDGGEGEYIDIVHITDMAVVTSGVYERYYTVDGQRYHHIINGHTLMPAYNFDAVTIVAPSSGLADSLTTALFNMSLEDGREMIEALDDVAALWIKDGEVTYSSRMAAILK